MDEQSTVASLGGSSMVPRVEIVGIVSLGEDEEGPVDHLHLQEDTEKGSEALTVEEEEEEAVARMIEILTRSRRTEVIEEVIEEQDAISEEGAHMAENEVNEEVDTKARLPSLSYPRYTHQSPRIIAYHSSALHSRLSPPFQVVPS